MKEREYRGPDSQTIQRMFAAIAHRYDFLNHFLSVSIDRRWRRAAVHRLNQLVRSSSSTICLDLCSGTGDLALAVHQRLMVDVVASDFCHPMLTLSVAKIAKKGFDRSIRVVEADALSLPFRGQSFDAVTIAFGLRNLEDPLKGFEEVRRVLKPGGAVVVLEFSRPVAPVMRNLFGFYFRTVLPKIGSAISGDGHAYQYLPDSVQQFPDQMELVAMMNSVGFQNVGYENLTGGIAALHWGVNSG